MVIFVTILLCSVAYEIFAATQQHGGQRVGGHGEEFIDDDGITTIRSSAMANGDKNKNDPSAEIGHKLKSNKPFLVRKKIYGKKSLTNKYTTTVDVAPTTTTDAYLQKRLRQQPTPNDNGELLQRSASVKQTRAVKTIIEEDDDDYYSRRRARFLFRQRVGK